MANSRATFLPDSASFPDTNFPQLQKVGVSPKRFALSFDAATDESALWTDGAPQGLTGTLKLILHCIMASATSGNVIFQASVEAITPVDAVDLDAGDSFDTANASSATAVPATAGHMFAVEITLTNKDSIAAGDYYRVKLNRDADNAGDTATGDCHVLKVELQDAV